MLLDGLDYFKIRIANGILPSTICFGIMEHESLHGSYLKSSTEFKTHDLESFDLQLNNQSVNFFPLARDGDSYYNFYHRFLKEGKFWENPFSSGPIDYDNFRTFNFLIVADLENQSATFGELTAIIKFKTALSKKFFLVYLPVYTKRLVFDSSFNPTVEYKKTSKK